MLAASPLPAKQPKDSLAKRVMPGPIASPGFQRTYPQRSPTKDAAAEEDWEQTAWSDTAANDELSCMRIGCIHIVHHAHIVLFCMVQTFLYNAPAALYLHCCVALRNAAGAATIDGRKTASTCLLITWLMPFLSQLLPE